MDISEYYPALAVFIALTFITTVFGLSTVHGEPGRNYVYGYIFSKKWPFINEKNFMCYGRFFLVIYFILLLMPILTGLTWAGITFYLRRNDTYVGPISIILILLSGVCFIMSQCFVFWNSYSNTWSSIVLIAFSAASIVGYQLLGNFYYTLENSFFGISAMFLSYNFFIITVIIYLNMSGEVKNFGDILKIHVKQENPNFIPHAITKDLVTSIEEDMQNDKYALTIPEYKSFVTITNSNEKINIGATGLETGFANLSQATRYGINFLLYIISLAILGVYAVVARETQHESLGATISVAVVATDIMLFALYHSNVLARVGGGCIMAMIFRGCLFAFGGKYWYFGCCLFYALAGVKVAFEKVRQQFPFVETQRISIKEKIESKNSTSAYKMDVLREPIVAWLFCTTLFAILTVILDFTKPNGVELPNLYLGDKDSPYWLMAILAFLFSVFCYFVMATIRIATLKAMKYIPRIFKYFIGMRFDEFWIYIFLAYALIISTALILFYFVGNELLIIYSGFCPFIAIIILYCGMIYNRNDYSLIYTYKIESHRAEKKRKKLAKLSFVLVKQAASATDAISDTSDEEEEIELEDWRKNYNFLSAFIEGKLHGRDYKLLLAILIFFIVTFFLGFTIQVLGDDSPFPEAWIGFTSAIMIICFFLVSGALASHLSTGFRMSIVEIIILIIGIIGYIAYGVLFFVIREEGDIDIDYNMYVIPIYAGIFPSVVLLLMTL